MTESLNLSVTNVLSDILSKSATVILIHLKRFDESFYSVLLISWCRNWLFFNMSDLRYWCCLKGASVHLRGRDKARSPPSHYLPLHYPTFFSPSIPIYFSVSWRHVFSGRALCRSIWSPSEACWSLGRSVKSRWSSDHKRRCCISERPAAGSERKGRSLRTSALFSCRDLVSNSCISHWEDMIKCLK